MLLDIPRSSIPYQSVLKKNNSLHDQTEMASSLVKMKWRVCDSGIDYGAVYCTSGGMVEGLTHRESATRSTCFSANYTILDSLGHASASRYPRTSDVRAAIPMSV